MKIIVPLRPQSTQQLAELLQQVTNQVDIVEIWLDGLVSEIMMNPALIESLKTNLQAVKSKQKVQLLAVCKTPAEKGVFAGSAVQRIQILQKWLEMGGDYVDVDVSQNDASLIAQIPKEKLWLSFHDFNWADLQIIKLRLETMQMFEPALYKFSVTPQSKKDLKDFLQWCSDLKKTAIFTTMGPFGSEGRGLLKPYTYGAFYALSPQHITASGQPTLADL